MKITAESQRKMPRVRKDFCFIFTDMSISHMWSYMGISCHTLCREKSCLTLWGKE